MDGIELEILWSNLIGIVSEQAKALQRIAFSPDRARGRRPGQRPLRRPRPHGRPGQHRHARPHQLAGRRGPDAWPSSSTTSLAPGDIVITNDPWMSAGHFFDITVLAPVFWDERLIGYIGSTIHHTDIGGYGIGAGARDIHEEGLWIPPLKLYEAGEPNADPARHHPQQRAHARPRVRRPRRAGLQRPGRRRAADRALPAPGAARHRGAVRRDHRPLGGRDAQGDPRAAGRHLAWREPASTCRAATSSR